MPTPRGLLSTPVSPPQTLCTWSYETMRSIGMRHGSPPDDGKPVVSSMSDMQWGGYTHVEYSAYEREHGVDRNRKYHSDIFDML